MKKINPFLFAKVSILSLAFFITSCSNDNIESIDDANTTVLETTTKIEKKYFGENEIYGFVDENGDFLSDDMIFDKSQITDTPQESLLNKSPIFSLDEKMNKQGLLSSSAVKWPNGVVIYKLGKMTNRLRGELQKAMDEWSAKTNVSFKLHTNESYFVTILESTAVCSGCGRATIGVSTNRGTCVFGKDASSALIAHELGHTLGFLHEQTRSDRDSYVRVLFNNIQTGKEGNFKKSSTAVLTTKQFDINSIMMYHPYAFTNKPGVPTIVDATTGRPYQGAQRSVSALDIEGTNSVYPIVKDVPVSINICKDVSPWVSGTRYLVGSRVVYQGYLYEANFSSWEQIGKCKTEEAPTDKCEGINAYNSAIRYNSGAKVTFKGYLFTLTSQRTWQNNGKCGS